MQGKSGEYDKQCNTNSVIKFSQILIYIYRKIQIGDIPSEENILFHDKKISEEYIQFDIFYQKLCNISEIFFNLTTLMEKALFPSKLFIPNNIEELTLSNNIDNTSCEYMHIEYGGYVLCRRIEEQLKRELKTKELLIKDLFESVHLLNIENLELILDIWIHLPNLNSKQLLQIDIFKF